MSFKRWLMHQRFKPNEIGSLGLFAHFNGDFPSNASWRDYKAYLYTKDVPDTVLSVFEDAWNQYWDMRKGCEFCRYRKLQNVLKILKKPLKALQLFAQRILTKRTASQ